jgi:hypothetical protein
MRNVLCATGLALGLVACEGRQASAPAGSEQLSAGTQLPLPTLDRVLQIPHRGVRRVEVYDGGASPVLAFRESIVVAGDGQRFGLEPLEALTPVPDEWIHGERLWARFSFRYRNFVVRDPEAFLRNWRLTDLAQPATVAGRKGSRYLVERQSGGAGRYELVLDEELGLILSSSRFDAQGRLVLHVEYESLEEQFDLQTAVWTQSLIDDVALDPTGDLRDQVGAPVPIPLRIPAGFELREASTASFEGRDWLRLVYHDGVEPVFFLGTWTEPDGGAQTQGAPGSQLVSGRLGAVNIVQAVCNGDVFVGVGALTEDELADLVESALP